MHAFASKKRAAPTAVQRAVNNLKRAKALSLALSSLTKHTEHVPPQIAAHLLDASTLTQTHVVTCEQALDRAEHDAARAGPDVVQAQKNVDEAMKMLQQLNANPCADDAMKASASRIVQMYSAELDAAHARAPPPAVVSMNDMMMVLSRHLDKTAYVAKSVSWEDVQRTLGSCVGPNIADVRLIAQSGAPLCTLGCDNFQGKVCLLSASDISLGTESLASYLSNIGDRCKGIGMDAGTNLLARDLDTKCSVRFTQTYLPPQESQFCSTVYNYQTTDEKNPRNTLIAAAKMGVSVCQDVPGAQKLLINGPLQDDGSFEQSWFKAMPRLHADGGGADGRGAADDDTLGLPGMDRGDAECCIITVQVPHEPPPPPPPLRRSDGDDAPTYRSLSAPGASAVTLEVGDVARQGQPLRCTAPRRHPTEHITVTFSFYAWGVPTAADVHRAVAKLDSYYAMGASGSRHNSVIAAALE